MATGRRATCLPAALAVRAALVSATVCLLLMVVLPHADAHALLISSDPPAGSDLASVPAVVTLTFDEPLVATLSRATVTDPSGRTFSAHVSAEHMRVRLHGRARGVYRVHWKTVSKVDGHVITGDFEFGVRASASATPAASGPTAGDIAVSALRGVEYALLLLATGMWLLDLLARDLRVEQPTRPVAAGLLLAGVLVVATETWLAGSGLSWRGADDYLTGGMAGWARTARLLLEATLLAVAVATRRLAPVVLIGICVTIALSGHGSDVEPAWQGIAVNAAHLVAAGAWAGGIMALALMRFGGHWQEQGRPLMHRFSRVAPWAFLASVVLGAVQAVQLLGSPQSLLGSSYGLTLVAKAVAVAAMVLLSLLAWRRMRVHLRAEAALALVVVGAAAALAAFPVIPKEAREAAAEQSPQLAPPSSALPRPGDLTVGGRAGAVMVGLTLHPGRPGPNTVTAYLASPASRSTTARLHVAGRTLPMARCGAQCRTTTFDLVGHERVSVQVPGQGTASYVLPRLPAPGADALMQAAGRRMMRLHSYLDRQDLSGIRSEYRYVVPHQLFTRTWFGDGPQDSLWIGRRLYRRDSPTARWKLSSRGIAAPVPYYPWLPFRPLIDCRLLGHAGSASDSWRELSCFGGHGPSPDAVWFSVYVDRDGFIRRSRMWATSHFMDDRFTRFDERLRLPRLGGA